MQVLRRIVGGSLVVLWCAMACGSDDEPPREFAEPCDESKPCAPGLVCKQGLCTTECDSMEYCVERFGESAMCSAGLCRKKCDAGCSFPAVCAYLLGYCYCCWDRVDEK